MLEAKNDRLMLSSKCVICGSKKLRFLKQQQQSKGLLSNLSGLKTPLSTIPILGDVLF